MFRNFATGLALALVLGALSAPAQASDPVKPDEKLGILSPTSGKDETKVQEPRTPSRRSARVADGSYSVAVPDFTKSASADCQTLNGVLDVYTGTDQTEWLYADVEWNVNTAYGDNPGYGEISYDGSYTFEALYWCPSLDGFGTFPLDMTITFYDWDYNVIDVAYLTDTFRVSRLAKASSSVSYNKLTYRAHGWKFPVRVTRAGKAWRDKAVVMQARFCGSWRKVFTKRTNLRGRVTFYTTPRAGWNTERFCGVRGSRIPFRFYVAGNQTTNADYSSTFRVTRR